MRPVNKGEHPKTLNRRLPKNFNDPGNAKDDLVERLGPYCSYCEQRYPKSALDVEHVLPKEEGMYPELFAEWANFLLSCRVCNSRKNNYIQNCPEYRNAETGRTFRHHFELDDFLWPHLDNTFEAFEYLEDGRIEPRGDDEDMLQRAANTLQMLRGHAEPGDRDDQPADIFRTPPPSESRAHRCYIWNVARQALETLMECDNERAFSSAIQLALYSGYWSIWMKVFSQDPDENRRRRFYQAMLERFPGTAHECFDHQANAPARRPKNTCLP